MKKDLLIVGGGYAGTTLVHHLANHPNLNITLLDGSKYHLAQAKLHRYLSGEVDFDEVAFDLNDFCKQNKANFIHDKVLSIDTQKKRVSTANKNLQYDYLVLATGAVSLFPKQIENIHAYELDLKNLNDLQRAKKDVDKLFLDNSKEHTIAVIGAGLSGAEIALELAQKAQKHPHISIALIEQKPTPLPDSDPRLISEAIKACNALHVKRYHGAFVTRVQTNTIYLSDDRVIPFSLAFFVIGVRPSVPQIIPDAPKNKQGLIIVDEYNRIQGFENVFALGDIAYSKDANGNQNLPTAQVAKQQAKSLAKHLKEELANKKLSKPTPVQNKGVLVDLGGKNAVGVAFGIPIYGKLAYLVKRTVCRLHTRIFS